MGCWHTGKKKPLAVGFTDEGLHLQVDESTA